MSEETEVVSEAKRCPSCGKQLRKDNTRGACSKCMAKGFRPDGAEASNGAERKPRRAKPKRAEKPEPPTNGDAVARLRAVAEGLGLDADEILGVMAQSWLDQLKAAVQADDDEPEAEE